MIINNSANKHNRKDALRKVRAEALFSYINDKGSVTINNKLYDLAREQGFTRNQIDLAISDLIEQGRVSISHSGLWLTVKPKTETKSEVVAL